MKEGQSLVREQVEPRGVIPDSPTVGSLVGQWPVRSRDWRDYDESDVAVDLSLPFDSRNRPSRRLLAKVVRASARAHQDPVPR